MGRQPRLDAAAMEPVTAEQDLRRAADWIGVGPGIVPVAEAPQAHGARVLAGNQVLLPHAVVRVVDKWSANQVPERQQKPRNHHPANEYASA